MSSSKTKVKATSGSKTSNVKVALEMLKDVGKLGESMPYLEGVAGLLKTVLDMKQQYTESKEAWVKTMECVREIQEIIEQSIKRRDDTSLPLPEHLKDAMAALETCLVSIAEAFDRIESMNGVKRFFRRLELKADAEACGVDAARALQLFQTKLQIKIAVQMDNVHTVITEGAITSVAGQATLAAQMDTVHRILTSGAISSVVGESVLPVCPSPSDFFTGRVALLELLTTIFERPGRRVVTIVGKGGSGKTQLMLKFVEQKKSRFSCIFFVDASSAQTIQAAFGLIAKVKRIGSSIDETRNWFSGHTEKWLLIFDNADDPSLDLGQYLPRSSHGNIIITSRNHEVSCLASPGGVVLLPDLEETDAVDLLLKSARLKKKSIQSPNGYMHTVFSAFELSYLQLSKTAKTFLHIMSFFHHSNIPLEIIQVATMYTLAQNSQSDAGQQLKDFLSAYYSDTDQEWLPLSFQDTLTELQQFSIISFNSDTYFMSLHPLIHACAGDLVEDKDTAHIMALELLAYGTSTTEDLEDITLCVQIAPHAEHLWYTRAVPCSALEQKRIAIVLAFVFWRAGIWAKAESMWLEVIAIHKRKYGPNHPATLQYMNNLGVTYYTLGQFEEAKNIQEEVLRLEKEIGRESHPDMWAVMSNLASTYLSLRYIYKAEELQKESLKQQMEVLGDQHPNTLGSMGNLATTYSILGRLDEAKRLQKVVLKLQRKLHGEKHPDTCLAMDALAITYYKCDKPSKALKLQQVALRLHTEILGERHLDTLQTMCSLANSYSKLGQLTKAKILEEKVLSLQREIIGEKHPDIWIVMNNLASTYHRLGQLDDAKVLQENVLRLRNEASDEETDTTTWHNMTLLAHIYCSLGQFQEAAQLQERVVQYREEILGYEHPNTWPAMEDLAETYRHLGRLDEADQMETNAARCRGRIALQEALQAATQGLNVRIVRVL